MIIHQNSHSKVAIINKDEIYNTTIQEALDLMANIRYQGWLTQSIVVYVGIL